MITFLPMDIQFPLIPLSVSLNWRSKDKNDPQAAVTQRAPQALSAADREFLYTLAILIALYGACVTLSGMVLAHAARR